MTNDEFHARRTELSNTFAAAGAELLDYMGCAGALAAIPNTQQYVVAGDPAAIRTQLDTVEPQRRMRHGQRPEHELYWPETGQPRRWAALITSAGHGVLQEYGTAFEHALPGQEVLEVAEILPGAAIANKAAEEGELPEFPQLSEDWIMARGMTYKQKHMREYARQAIAADRASRQVANKAEGDQEALLAITSDGKGGWKFTALKDFQPFEGMKLCATPPATTGASTAPHEIAKALGLYEPVSMLCAVKAIESLRTPAPASTVLTDEQVDECIDLAVAIEREVAAQAGQVAVPEAVRVLREAIQKQLAPDWECNSNHPALFAALKATGRLAATAKESK